MFPAAAEVTVEHRDTEKRSVRFYAEKFGNDGGKSRKESAVSNAVYRGKYDKHPQRLGHLQP